MNKKRTKRVPLIRAAIESESFPPSTAMLKSDMMSHIALHASYIFAPSPGNFAAHIQFPAKKKAVKFQVYFHNFNQIHNFLHPLPEHLTSANSLTFTNAKFEIASATLIRALAAAEITPFAGCIPIDVAIPWCVKCDTVVQA